jgi:hypothetical protein
MRKQDRIDLFVMAISTSAFVLTLVCLSYGAGPAEQTRNVNPRETVINKTKNEIALGQKTKIARLREKPETFLGLMVLVEGTYLGCGMEGRDRKSSHYP